jgi:hypothetical protein
MIMVVAPHRSTKITRAPREPEIEIEAGADGAA